MRHRLPESVRYIDLYQRDPNDSPILSMMITAPMLDEQGAYTLLDQLKMRLERLNGVNSVEGKSAFSRIDLEIALDPARLESLGVQVVVRASAIRKLRVVWRRSGWGTADSACLSHGAVRVA